MLLSANTIGRCKQWVRYWGTSFLQQQKHFWATTREKSSVTYISKKWHVYQNAFLASRPSSPSPVPLPILHSCNYSLLSTWYKCCTQQMTSPLLKHLTHRPSPVSLHYWQTRTGHKQCMEWEPKRTELHWMKHFQQMTRQARKLQRCINRTAAQLLPTICVLVLQLYQLPGALCFTSCFSDGTSAGPTELRCA